MSIARKNDNVVQLVPTTSDILAVMQGGKGSVSFIGTPGCGLNLEWGCQKCNQHTNRSEYIDECLGHGKELQLSLLPKLEGECTNFRCIETLTPWIRLISRCFILTLKFESTNNYKEVKTMFIENNGGEHRFLNGDMNFLNWTATAVESCESRSKFEKRKRVEEEKVVKAAEELRKREEEDKKEVLGKNLKSIASSNVEKEIALELDDLNDYFGSLNEDNEQQVKDLKDLVQVHKSQVNGSNIVNFVSEFTEIVNTVDIPEAQKIEKVKTQKVIAVEKREEISTLLESVKKITEKETSKKLNTRKKIEDKEKKVMSMNETIKKLRFGFAKTRNMALNQFNVSVSFIQGFDNVLDELKSQSRMAAVNSNSTSGKVPKETIEEIERIEDTLGELATQINRLKDANHQDPKTKTILEKFEETLKREINSWDEAVDACDELLKNLATMEQQHQKSYNTDNDKKKSVNNSKIMYCSSMDIDEKEVDTEVSDQECYGQRKVSDLRKMFGAKLK
eukprot:Awhi_evm1s8904